MAIKMCGVSVVVDGSHFSVPIGSISGACFLFLLTGDDSNIEDIRMPAPISCWTVNNPSAISNIVRGGPMRGLIPVALSLKSSSLTDLSSAINK